MSESTHLEPYSKAVAQLPVACSTVPLVLQATGICLETKLAISTSCVKAAVLPSYYKLSLIRRLSPESQEGAENEALL